MAWLFLIGAAFFILGGLLSVQPSKTQKRIAGLRESAISAGVHVKLPVSLTFPDDVGKSGHPYYCKNLLDRKLAQQFIHVLRDEQGQIKATGNKKQSSLLSKKLQAMPSDFSAIYLGAGLLGISWNESGVSVVPESLLECLAELETELQSFN